MAKNEPADSRCGAAPDRPPACAASGQATSFASPFSRQLNAQSPRTFQTVAQPRSLERHGCLRHLELRLVSKTARRLIQSSGCSWSLRLVLDLGRLGIPVMIRSATPIGSASALSRRLLRPHTLLRWASSPSWNLVALREISRVLKSDGTFSVNRSGPEACQSRRAAIMASRFPRGVAADAR
jgi:hypothetical protein